MAITIEAAKSIVYTVAHAGKPGEPFDAALDTYVEAVLAQRRADLADVD